MKQQGDAAFWWNLKRSGDGDDSTRHAGCPVLVGSKWGKISKYVFICDINLLLTERQGRTGILARARCSTNRAQRGPYKNIRGHIFTRAARAS